MSKGALQPRYGQALPSCRSPHFCAVFQVWLQVSSSFLLLFDFTFSSPFLHIAPCVIGCQIHSPHIKPPLAQLPQARPRTTPFPQYLQSKTNQPLLQGQAGQTSCFNSCSLGFIIIFVVWLVLFFTVYI